GGLGMIGAPVHEAGPARAFAVGGALVELVVEQQMEQTMGHSAETLHTGTAGTWMKAAKVLTIAGAAGAVCGMIEQEVPAADDRPLIAATMFGVTTPCVTAVR